MSEFLLDGRAAMEVYMDRYEVRILRVFETPAEDRAELMVTDIVKSLELEKKRPRNSSEEELVEAYSSEIFFEGRIVLFFVSADVDNQQIELIIGQPASPYQRVNLHRVGSSQIYEGETDYEVRLKSLYHAPAGDIARIEVTKLE